VKGEIMFGNEERANRTKVVLLCVFLLLFGIFLGKNFTPTTVWIFGWNPSIPLIVIVAVCFIAGCGCGWLLSVLFRQRLQDG